MSPGYHSNSSTSGKFPPLESSLPGKSKETDIVGAKKNYYNTVIHADKWLKVFICYCVLKLAKTSSFVSFIQLFFRRVMALTLGGSPPT